MSLRASLPWMALAVVTAAVSVAADSTVGTLTVKGKAAPLKHGYAAVQQDPDDAERSWLVILVANVPVKEADRTPARLAELAAAGKVKAVRVLWLEGFDTVFAVPYHQALPQSGRRGAEHPTVKLDRYDEQRYEGTVKSKMLGQDWFFEVHVKADLARGGVAELEPAIVEEEPTGQSTPPGDDRTANKRELGRLGYEYTSEMFERAAQDANAEAVRLFLAAGISPNTGEGTDRHPLLLAVTQCAYGHELEALEIVEALLAAGAKADAGAKDGITPLLNAAQHCTGPDIVKALIAAGANVNTKAPGGATPLMFAKVFSKKEIEAELRRAGARD
ncbi:MAG: ankyrin repeat domain-containing protein [Acidobacteria bacterium]|nr:ankyrin repeat domain-containing protein [Acidobacteriota bacterium]